MPNNTTLFIFQSAPVSSLFAQEGLDALFAARAFEQAADALFIGDGIQLLNSKQSPSGQANLFKQICSMPMYDIDTIFVCKASAQNAQLSIAPKSLQWVQLDSQAIAAHIQQYRHVLTF